MSRATVIDRITTAFDQGHFLQELTPRVAIPTESQEPDRGVELDQYLRQGIVPLIEPMGFEWRILDNPRPEYGPFLLAERIEGADRPTVFIYGHGDVVRGYAEQWRAGLSPWQVIVEGERIYGRGTADNKGQHLINLMALGQVLAVRGSLGFNVKLLIETGEETGSPGLKQICAQHREFLQADVLIASDGPRLTPEQPTLFLGSRGAYNFDLTVDLRAGGHHSGNWGGALANPGTILAHAIASLVDQRGQLRVPGLCPPPIPDNVRRVLAHCVIDGGSEGPQLDPDWGEPGLTPTERVIAWNTLEVLACKTGNPDRPVNAIPPKASAHCQIRFVVGSDWQNFTSILQDHLDQVGLTQVKVTPSSSEVMVATRLDPDHAWVHFANRSIQTTTGQAAVVLPNLGGSLPNDVFADLLGLPTVWVPHSYASCSQHAPNEHLLIPVVRQGLQIMAGIFWDLGETPL